MCPHKDTEEIQVIRFVSSRHNFYKHKGVQKIHLHRFAHTDT